MMLDTGVNVSVIAGWLARALALELVPVTSNVIDAGGKPGVRIEVGEVSGTHDVGFATGQVFILDGGMTTKMIYVQAR